MDQGITFQKEDHGVDSLSKILHWIYRIEEENLQNLIEPHTERIKIGIAPVKGARIQEAKERSIALWHNKAQEQALRSNALGVLSFAPSVPPCWRVSAVPARPQTPGAMVVVADGEGWILPHTFRTHGGWESRWKKGAEMQTGNIGFRVQGSIMRPHSP